MSYYYDDPYIASIVPFAGATPPTNWMKCEGQIMQIYDYQALFSLIGNRYGGDGINTFALPDLRNKVPIGADTTHLLGSTGMQGNSDGPALPLTGISYIIAINGVYPPRADW